MQKVPVRTSYRRGRSQVSVELLRICGRCKNASLHHKRVESQGLHEWRKHSLVFQVLQRMRIPSWEPGVEARVTQAPRIQTWEDRGGEGQLVALRSAPRMPTVRCLAAFALLLRGLLLPRDLLGRVQRRHGPGFFPAITRSKSSRLRLMGRAAPMF